ncbi:50S ribosomal protein L6 [Candidatus Woesearchaeota archaeon]|nr:50S ribosomal protein L6 [Candidatus Woesearchaeota archaeon]
MKSNLKEEVALPEGVEANYKSGILLLKGPKGEIKRQLVSPKIKISVSKEKISLESPKATKREKRLLYTFNSHIKNMLKGVTEGHVYELKICSGHFPMNVSVTGNELMIKNFLGENNPRKMKIKEGVKVTIEGDHVKVEGTEKEATGQTAADIELLTKVRGRDRRIFQDGIFIINKDGKEIK